MPKKIEGGNIILITIDSLRPDHLSCYGYEKETSPNIDGLAERGILFGQALSNGGHTRIAFPVLFSSTYFFSYRFLEKRSQGFTTYLCGDRPYLPEILKKYGYKTAGFHSNPFLTQRYGYGRGFDILYDPLEKENKTSKKNIRSFVQRHLKPDSPFYKVLKLIYNKFVSRDVTLPFARGEEITRNALSWIKNNMGFPFFIWLHYMDVHHPYIPPKKHLSKVSNSIISMKEAKTLHTKMLKKPDSMTNNDLRKLIDLYNGCINYVDFWIGNFLYVLENMNLLDNSLIILTADHGEAFGEHGDFGHGEIKANLYDEVIRIPLIIQTPEGKRRIVGHQVDLLDIAPTILDFSLIRKPNEMMGQSLLSALSGKYRKRASFSESLDLRAGGSPYLDEKHFGKDPKNEVTLIKKRGIVSYRTEDWKYIHKIDGSCELYNLKTDPREKKNLINKEKEKADRFKSEVLKHINGCIQLLRTLELEKQKIRDRIRKLRRIKRI
jgi:arylsulfatase A-like enzyme